MIYTTTVGSHLLAVYMPDFAEKKASSPIFDKVV